MQSDSITLRDTIKTTLVITICLSGGLYLENTCGGDEIAVVTEEGMTTAWNVAGTAEKVTSELQERPRTHRWQFKAIMEIRCVTQMPDEADCEKVAEAITNHIYRGREALPDKTIRQRLETMDFR